MNTTTIRVDTETHALLLELSRATNSSLIDTVREAAEALRRRQFALEVVGELDQLRGDPEAWKAYLGAADSTSVTDGLR